MSVCMWSISIVWIGDRGVTKLSTPPFFLSPLPTSSLLQVFKHRIWPLLYLYWAYTAYGIFTAPSLAFAIGAFVLTYAYIDLYGAVLHIVLDNPNFLKLPLLGEACLEFQVRVGAPSPPPSLLLFRIDDLFSSLKKTSSLRTNHPSLPPFFPPSLPAVPSHHPPRDHRPYLPTHRCRLRRDHRLAIQPAHLPLTLPPSLPPLPTVPPHHPPRDHCADLPTHRC